MSVIKVNKIEHTGTTNGGVEIDSSGHVQVDGLQMPTVGPLSNRNLIINGAMQVSQRGTSAVQIGTGTYSLDRFRSYDNTSGTFTVQQVVDAPAGFKNSAKVTVTTAASSLTSNSQAKFQQRIEGNVITQLGLGTSAAKIFTLSFYVKSSVTGTYAVGFINGSNNRSYVATYSISSADTWEYKTITVQGDTSGTWATDNGIGLNIQWSLGIGSTYEATAGQWHASEESHTTSAVDLITTLNATWQITGIQLEVGEKATPFEHRSYGDELARCQRYYWRGNLGAGPIYLGNGANIPVGNSFLLPVTMRATPAGASISNVSAQNSNSYSDPVQNESKDGGYFYANMSVTAGTVERTDLCQCEAEL